MSEISKPKESQLETREEKINRWNDTVNAAYWLEEPGEKGVLISLHPDLKLEVIDKDPYWILTKFSGLPPNFSPDPKKLRSTLTGKYGYILTILKLLNGDPAKHIGHTRSEIKNIPKTSGGKADVLHPGWQYSE